MNFSFPQPDPFHQRAARGHRHSMQSLFQRAFPESSRSLEKTPLRERQTPATTTAKPPTVRASKTFAANSSSDPAVWLQRQPTTGSQQEAASARYAAAAEVHRITHATPTTTNAIPFPSRSRGMKSLDEPSIRTRKTMKMPMARTAHGLLGPVTGDLATRPMPRF